MEYAQIFIGALFGVLIVSIINWLLNSYEAKKEKQKKLESGLYDLRERIFQCEGSLVDLTQGHARLNLENSKQCDFSMKVPRLQNDFSNLEKSFSNLSSNVSKLAGDVHNLSGSVYQLEKKRR